MSGIILTDPAAFCAHKAGLCTESPRPWPPDRPRTPTPTPFRQGPGIISAPPPPPVYTDRE
ncbi:hypothetical protein FEZ32_04630 [Acidipropionibacterium jensenii]|nr:hypothetical protein FEZ32_04630 [Acidipropionibacterium jensenii]